MNIDLNNIREPRDQDEIDLRGFLKDCVRECCSSGDFDAEPKIHFAENGSQVIIHIPHRQGYSFQRYDELAAGLARVMGDDAINRQENHDDQQTESTLILQGTARKLLERMAEKTKEKDFFVEFRPKHETQTGQSEPTATLEKRWFKQFVTNYIRYLPGDSKPEENPDDDNRRFVITIPYSKQEAQLCEIVPERLHKTFHDNVRFEAGEPFNEEKNYGTITAILSGGLVELKKMIEKNDARGAYIAGKLTGPMVLFRKKSGKVQLQSAAKRSERMPSSLDVEVSNILPAHDTTIAPSDELRYRSPFEL